ncbi:unnamed protein product [Staurois parvus]|uniref:Uncharacterized protein n=1 Tax=Staurois parvus TaxID=386267 RepID=A0ABN9BES4_9NEOB|nr:unnamed protein product [Staurois parvus]
MTAGTGSPGIRSFGSPAGTASSGKAVGTSHQVRQRALSQLARQRAPYQVPDHLDQQRASSQLA